jgi:hypothetical protein
MAQMCRNMLSLTETSACWKQCCVDGNKINITYIIMWNRDSAVGIATG